MPRDTSGRLAMLYHDEQRITAHGRALELSKYPTPYANPMLPSRKDLDHNYQSIIRNSKYAGCFVEH